MDLEIITKGKKLTDNDREILLYLINHLDDLEGKSLKTIALKIYTSPASIVRLAQKLDFSGYLEMYYFLKNQKNGAQAAEAEIDINIDIEKIADSIRSIREIYINNQEKFIMIYANGFSSTIADYLHKKLLVNGVKTLLVSATDSSGIISNNIDDISMLISITKSGETPKVIEKMTLCRDNEIPNILFTGNGQSRAGELATLLFEVADENPLDTQNIKYNGFFGKLLLLLEYIVQEFVR